MRCAPSLAQLSVDVLDLPPESDALLHDIGACTIGACLKLPRAGLARRLGQELLDTLDRALGHIPDPRPAFVPPASFTAALQLPAPVEEARRRCCLPPGGCSPSLRGFLAADRQGRAAPALQARPRGPRRHLLRPGSRDGHARFRASRHRAARAPGTSCPAFPGNRDQRWKACCLLPLAARNLTLLPDAREQAETIVRLIERLRARLGENAVHGLDTVADHRPEYAWRTEPSRATGAKGTWLPLSRPLWVLHAPRPLAEIAAIPQHDGPLALLAGPERIESGWWDDNDIARDYFVARNPAQSLLWIYRERRAGGGWYLHGFFATERQTARMSPLLLCLPARLRRAALPLQFHLSARGLRIPHELVERAHELGYAALAITDECSVAGVVRAHEAAKKSPRPQAASSAARSGSKTG